MLEKRARLVTGLVLAAYVIPHVINHALGLISIDTMNAMLRGMAVVWGTPVGGVAMVTSLVVHYLLALLALYRRRSLRMPAWEAVRVILGLSIPLLLITHAARTRYLAGLVDVEYTYEPVLAALWLGGWWPVLRQILLLLAVCGHLSIGLHLWLRLKGWYWRAIPYIYPGAVLLPLLALLGFIRGGITVIEKAAASEWDQRLFYVGRALTPEAITSIESLEAFLFSFFLGMLGLMLAARQARYFLHIRRGVFHLTDASGHSVTAPVGQTVLEALNNAGIPHASVCGGRGRCTTCRVRVGTGLDELPAPAPLEDEALRRVDAAPNVRLACQTRPRGELAITPLIPPNLSPREAVRPGGVQGREQRVAAMFIDLRGSTALGEDRLPYDVVFILNQFFAEMAAALEVTGGHYAQFAGDGLMALYGLESGVEAGSREAIEGALEMLARLESLNGTFGHELKEPLRMGIGIHCGEAIVGTMGPPASPNFSAIGDNINIAARLEAQSKIYGCPLVVSADTAAAAGVDLSGFPRKSASVRGRGQPIEVFAVDDPSAIPGLEKRANNASRR